MADYLRILFTFSIIATSVSGHANPVELNWTGCDVSRTAYVNDLTAPFLERSGIKINLHEGDSSSGIRDVHEGTADLGGTSRYRLPDDPRETGVELVPVAWDALAIVVHKDNPVSDISLEQMKAIYTGKIWNWSSLGGGDQRIELLRLKSTDSGTGHALRELLLTGNQKKLRTGLLFESSESLARALIDSPNAIAVTGVSSARTGEFKVLTLDGIEPTFENIKSGAYGLYRPLYLAYDPTSPMLDSVKLFIGYINSKAGRDVMRANGVVPYMEAMSLVMKKVRDNEASYSQLVEKTGNPGDIE